MDDLIKALQLLRKYMYADIYSPTHCEHDIFLVCGVPFNDVSNEDVAKLEGFGFHWSEEFSAWESFRFGSC